MKWFKSLKDPRSSSVKHKGKLKVYHRFPAYLSTMLMASLLGSYLDLWMVGKGSYSFPTRPFSTVFSINILFTLCFLPLLTFIMIYVFRRVRRLTRFVVTLGSSLIAALIEQVSEKMGMFAHSNQWTHVYSIIGYFVFITFLWNFYKWLSKY